MIINFIKNNKFIISIIAILIAFITGLNFTEYFLNYKINKSISDYNNQQLASILSNIKYNNNILNSKRIISNKYTQYSAKYNSITKAIIVNTTTPDGYNGNINLLVAVKLADKNNTNNTVLGIKILQHNETPGLGDLIEPEKSSWLTQFYNKFIDKNNNNWGLKKDLVSNSSTVKLRDVDNTINTFDSLTGATITSRAVSNAIQDVLIFINSNPQY